MTSSGCFPPEEHTAENTQESAVPMQFCGSGSDEISFEAQEGFLTNKLFKLAAFLGRT